jgi:hypothetical protein
MPLCRIYPRSLSVRPGRRGVFQQRERPGTGGETESEAHRRIRQVLLEQSLESDSFGHYLLRPGVASGVAEAWACR